jgi:hypothetical protein
LRSACFRPSAHLVGGRVNIFVIRMVGVIAQCIFERQGRFAALRTVRFVGNDGVSPGRQHFDVCHHERKLL